MNEPPWHSGEMLVQERSGYRMPTAPIRPFMPDQHRLFFARQPVLFIGLVGEKGEPIATALAGAPGFISSPDAETLALAALPPSNDPASPALRAGAAIGLLGLEFGARRRNRANGVVLAHNETGFTLGVRQSFGNCPQYIHPRWPTPATAGGPAHTLPGLDLNARALIASADTFFVASSSGPNIANGGVDISHRGGPPGFVQVDGNRLTIPDYRGNRYFNTIGNLVLDPRAALLFIDWPTGGLLHLGGRATITWTETAIAAWSVHITDACWRPAALGLNWHDDPA